MTGVQTCALPICDRLAKYNQLLRIEEELDTTAIYAGPLFKKIAK